MALLVDTELLRILVGTDARLSLIISNTMDAINERLSLSALPDRDALQTMHFWVLLLCQESSSGHSQDESREIQLLRNELLINISRTFCLPLLRHYVDFTPTDTPSIWTVDQLKKCLTIACDILKISLTTLSEESDQNAQTVVDSIVTLTELCTISLNTFLSSREKHSNFYCDADDCSTQFICATELLSVSLDVMKLAKQDDTLNDDSLTNWLVNAVFVFTKLLRHSTSQESDRFLTYILPKFIQNGCGAMVLKGIWGVVHSFFEDDGDGYLQELSPTGFSLLCSLSRYCFLLDQDGASLLIDGVPLHQQDDFWKIIQCGLVHKNPMTRKRSIFLLKMIVDWSGKTNEEWKSFTSATPLFVFSHSEQCLSSWQGVILLLDVLEENQIHIIKPVLPKFDHLLQAGQPMVLHMSWCFLIFHRMFMHESNFIKKWGVGRFLQLDFSQLPVTEQGMDKFVHRHLLNVLQDSSLYSRELPECFAPLPSALPEFLSRTLASLKSKQDQVTFVRRFLEHAKKCSWSGVPLVNIFQALASIPHVPLLDDKSWPVLRELVKVGLGIPEIVLRASVQSYALKAIFQLVNEDILTIDEVVDFFSVFRASECLKRGTVQWNTSVRFLKHLTNGHCKTMCRTHFISYCKEAIKRLLSVHSTDNSLILPSSNECLRLARIIVMLADGDVIQPESRIVGDFTGHDHTTTLESLLIEMVNILSSADRRPYMPMAKVDSACLFLTCMLRELRHKNPNTSDSVTNSILQLLAGHAEDIVLCIMGQVLHGVDSGQDAERLQVYFQLLQELSLEEVLFPVFASVLPDRLRLCNEILISKDNRNGCDMDWKLFKFLAWACSFGPDPRFETAAQQIFQLADSLSHSQFLTEQWKKFSHWRSMARHSPTVSNHLIFETESCIWQVILFYLQQAYPVIKDSATLISQAMETLKDGCKQSVEPVLQCLKYLLPLAEKDMFEDCVKTSWNACLELRKSNLFRPALKSFIQMAFQHIFMESLSASEILQQYSRHLFKMGDDTADLVNILVQHCCQIWRDTSQYPSVFNHISTLCSALTFGPILKRNERVIRDTVAWIIKEDILDCDLIKSNYEANTLVRMELHSFLRMLQPERTEHQQLAEMLTQMLLNADQEESSGRSRYYANSVIHRVKNRIWQSIITILPVLSQDCCQEVLNAAYHRLMEENQQPSVRYLQEWVVVKILAAHREFQRDLPNLLAKASENRPSSACSILSIMVHLVATFQQTLLQATLPNWVPLLVPWCMTQNFSARVYAHAALRKLHHLYEMSGMSEELKKYQLIWDGLESSTTGNMAKNAQKLLEDFYFSRFHPVKHYSLETIFFDFPRLTGLTEEEWIDPAMFEESFKKYTDFPETGIPIYNKDADLKESPLGAWILKPSAFHAGAKEYPEHSTVQENFQKKIMPWTQMLPDIETCQDLDAPGKQRDSEGLIVVASLVDRIPNLGGLCRTCEVFGVSEYVLANLHCVEDRQFQNLSVSSDKWIPLREVKPHQLKDFVLYQRTQGYTVVGVEQATDSKCVGSYQFPKNTLLLLGNEKEGLPVELLQLLDACIEIPQRGVIRSLNVHVSGAIIIWEYARQHYFYDQKLYRHCPF